MENLKEFRAFLGPAGDDYQDAQLEQLQREMQIMAELLLDLHFSSTTAKPRQIDGGNMMLMIKSKGRKNVTQF